MKDLEQILYLKPLELNGPEQMAIDLLLLEKSFTDKNFQIAFRFYTWNGNWLSIGKNQKEISKEWVQLSKDKELNLVRRPSGGKAVLHSAGLTYAIIWKNPPRNKKESYIKTTQGLKDGFQKFGLDLSFGTQAINASNRNCFGTSTLADLVDKDRNKHIGSAQFWKKGHLLQHGEILMEPSNKLWKKVFNNDPPKIKIQLKERDKIITYLKESLINIWPNLKFSYYELTQKDREIIKLLVKENFNEFNH